ncbi:MAG: DJ-1/PfpI family protein [Nitrospinales bacterium]
MAKLTGKNIFLAIPKSQFCEEELLPIRKSLEESGARVFVLSKSGQEARGMNKTPFQPNGAIIDWNKQEGISGKYHAVLVLGGKGAAKSLWNDPILPQILTDHYRASRITGAIGQGVVVLARAGLVSTAAAPKDQNVLNELQAERVSLSEDPVCVSGTAVTAEGKNSVDNFVETIERLLIG